MGLLEKAGQIEEDKTSAEKPKVAEPESVKEVPEPVAQPEPVKTKKEKRSRRKKARKPREKKVRAPKVLPEDSEPALGPPAEGHGDDGGHEVKDGLGDCDKDARGGSDVPQVRGEGDTPPQLQPPHLPASGSGSGRRRRGCNERRRQRAARGEVPA